MQALVGSAGDIRVLFTPLANLGMSAGWNDLWGYGPTVLTRYSRFMAAAEGAGAELALPYVARSRSSPVHRMLRCQYAVLTAQGPQLTELPNPLPHALLVPHWRVLATDQGTSIIAELLKPEFDPRSEVILESNPGIVAGDAVTTGCGVTLVETPGTDELVIEAETSTSQMLLVTDGYARGWTAQALSGSSQMHYKIMPADYVLRGIPLEPGHHRILLRYELPAFAIGRVVSVVALTLWVLGATMWLCGVGRRGSKAVNAG
jgi:hypothetical protein